MVVKTIRNGSKEVFLSQAEGWKLGGYEDTPKLQWGLSQSYLRLIAWLTRQSSDDKQV